MKGLLGSLEAIIAILIILTVFITFYTGRDAIPEFETVNWKIRGYDALKSLDDNGNLRDAVVANSSSAIESRLKRLLPAQLNYQIVVCDRNCGDPNIQSDKLTSVTYLVSGDLNRYMPRQVVLYLWSI